MGSQVPRGTIAAMDVCLFVDHQCNLRCRYCYNGEHFARRMPRERAEKAIELALSKRPPQLDVSFFGGEPLLRIDWIREVVAHVEQRMRAAECAGTQVRFIMNTNGTLLDDRAIDLMAPPRAFTVFVSLDGEPDVHDRARPDALGRPSHARVVAGIERLRQAKIPFELLAVVTPESARAVGKTVQALHATGAGRVVLSPNLGDDWTTEAVEELRLGLGEACAFWADRFRAGEIVRVDPLHTKILTHLYGGSPCPSRCQLGQREWAVAPSGKLYACGQMVGEDNRDDLVIGHVDTGFDLAAVDRLQRQKNRIEQTCAECAQRDRCQSHCGCQHLGLTGQLGEITAVLCELESAFIEAADELAETLWNEKCPAFLAQYYERQWVPAAGAALFPLRRARDVPG